MGPGFAAGPAVNKVAGVPGPSGCNLLLPVRADHRTDQGAAHDAPAVQEAVVPPASTAVNEFGQ
jgi:hypothetical protein